MKAGCKCQTRKIENMDPITATIAKEVVTKAAEKIADKAAEKSSKYTVEKVNDATRLQTDNPVISTCERLSSDVKAGKLSDAALATRMEAAAHSACKFFGLPEPELIKGDSIAVSMKRCDLFMTDDKFLFNLDQFKDMNSLSFEDMSKVWSHECGHRVLRFYNMSPWAQELGADFFMGVRSEMLGLPNGNLEKVLGESKGGLSHPPGNLRLQAIQYGREVVRDYQKAGIPITMQNMRENFRLSHFAKIGSGEVADTKVAAFTDNKAWHYKEAAKAQENADYYSKEAKKAADKGDFSRAKDLQNKAQSYETKVRDEKKSADMCSKLVEATEPEMVEKHRLPRSNGKWENIEGDSKFVPDDNIIPKDRNYSNPDGLTWGEIKEKYKIDGVSFKDGYPNFSEVSKGDVEIDNFTTERYGAGGNFDQADKKLASQRGCSAEEVRQWCNDNNYTWHEMQDCKTMQKVPREVHSNIPHDGGISKLKNAI